jgi:hypothetical protein
MKRIGFIALSMVILLLTGGVAQAQGDDYDIGRSVISSGGGERESGDYTIIDVIGQPTSGRCESGGIVTQAAAARADGDGLILVTGFLTPLQGSAPAPTPPPTPTRVPTTSEWGMIGMVVALAALLIWSVRRRRVISAGKS